MKRLYRFISLLLALLLNIPLLTGCSTPAPFSGMTVVTSFFPLYTAAANIMDGALGVELVNLAQPSVGCLHDYQLTPKDMRTLEGADLLIINGMGMEEFMDNVFTALPGLPVVTASEGVTPIEEACSHDHGHEDEDEGHAEEHHHEQNAHAWVSIPNYIQYVKNIRDALCEKDSRNAALYTQNAESYIGKLTSLYERMKEELAAAKGQDIITFHEAFSYFAEDFGLHVAAVLEREPGMGPSASELAETVDLVRETGVSVLFVEPQYSSDVADVVARETGARIFTLDPVVTGEEAKDAYLNAMEQNLKALQEALC